MADAALGKRFLDTTRGRIVSLLRRGVRTVEEAEEATRLLREVGRRMARGAGGPAGGTLQERVETAAAVLNALGGDMDVQVDDGTPRLQGHGCPLSTAVCRRPELCGAVETLVAEIVGVPVRECCERGTRPSCCFAFSPDARTDV